MRWHRHVGLLLILLGTCHGILGEPAQAENWPQWRGPRGNGVSGEKNLPTQWSAEEGVAWSLPLPGPAGSTPVVWEDRIFLTSVAGEDGNEIVLICVSTSGKQLWQASLASGNKNVRGDEGNSASPSPCTDGRFVWACTANGKLACFDLDGKPVWKMDLQERFGQFRIAFGMSATPVLEGEHLYLQLIHGDGNPQTREAKVVCLRAATGAEVWVQPRPSDARAECEHSYASPTVYRDGQRAFLLTHGADYIVAHDLKDGRELWRCGNLNPAGKYNPTLRLVASPVAADGLIVVPSAKKGPVLALRPDVEGDVTEKKSAYRWMLERGTPDVPSPLIHDGLVYLCLENGNLVCLDAETGEQYYLERTTRGRHRASPVLADGKLYLTSRDQGVVSVVAAGKKFQLLAQNELGDGISASPAIANGRIYLRTYSKLVAVGPRE